MVTARLNRRGQVLRVACMLTDQEGDAVYIRGQANGFYKVARADSTMLFKMPAIGVIIKKWDFTNALVQVSGEVRNQYTGLVPGRAYVIDSAGRPVLPETLVPLPGERFHLQFIGTALDVVALLVRPAENMIIRVG